jgi:hypothetical protein
MVRASSCHPLTAGGPSPKGTIQASETIRGGLRLVGHAVPYQPLTPRCVV